MKRRTTEQLLPPAEVAQPKESINKHMCWHRLIVQLWLLMLCPCVYLLQHAGSELHGLMVLLLQHVHVEVIQKVVSVIIHPALVQLTCRGERGEEMPH